VANQAILMPELAGASVALAASEGFYQPMPSQ
jgi:hypothetical protein